MSSSVCSPLRVALPAVCAVLAVACGGDDGAQPPNTDAGDAQTHDGSAADVGVDDSTADAAPDTDRDADASLDTYIANCGSLFAARVVEKQLELNPGFAPDCDTPLTNDVGALRRDGAALCEAGQSANACRDRLYNTPPDLDLLDQACLETSPGPGCLRGSWLARCADGTNNCASDEAVCADGTRPMIFAEEATAGPSNAWLFHLGGEGGPCSGAQCWGNYRFGESEFQRAMSSLHPDGPSGAAFRANGILSGNPSSPYGRLNRVRFERCTDVVTRATEQVPFADGVPAEFAANFPGVPVATLTATATVWHHGFDTWRSAFHQMTTPEGRDRDGDGTPEMPTLADAELVVLSASSDASTWLTFAADALADELRAIAGAEVEVRIMIDGNFPPMLDNAARYHPDVPAGFDFVDQTFEETALCQLPDNGDGIDNEACSGATLEPGGNTYESYAARGVLPDASCMEFHAADTRPCLDRNHVLVHHVGVPILVLADQEDNTVSDGAPAFANDRSYLFTEPALFRRFVLDEAHDLVRSWSTAAREEGAGAQGDLVLILPKTRREDQPWSRATHVRFGDDDEMNSAMTLCTEAGDAVVTLTYTQMMVAWFGDELPQTSAIEDAARPLSNGNFWVTGSACRRPE